MRQAKRRTRASLRTALHRLHIPRSRIAFDEPDLRTAAREFLEHLWIAPLRRRVFVKRCHDVLSRWKAFDRVRTVLRGMLGAHASGGVTVARPVGRVCRESDDNRV